MPVHFGLWEIVLIAIVSGLGLAVLAGFGYIAYLLIQALNKYSNLEKNKR